MPNVGDQVRIASTKVGQPPRDGVVTSVAGHLLRIRWTTGEESTIVPAPGTVAVVGQVNAISEKHAPAPAKAAKKPRAAKKS